jgi:putative FmdB family regulatory protein
LKVLHQPATLYAMPIYAYKCESCGFAKDILQKMSDPLLTDCPACGAATFQKQVTAAGFQLKGSGWYATDFRGGASGAEPTPATPGDAKPAEAAPAKTEPTAKAEPVAKATPTTPTAAS